MKKSHAHLVLAGIDIAAAFAAFYVFTVKSDLLALAAANAGEISYQSGFTYFLLLLIVPVVHAWSLFEAGLSIGNRAKHWANRSLVLVFLLLLLLAWILGQQIEKHLDAYGYTYCPEKSEFLTFSEFRVYVKEPDLCKNDA